MTRGVKHALKIKHGTERWPNVTERGLEHWHERPATRLNVFRRPETLFRNYRIHTLLDSIDTVHFGVKDCEPYCERFHSIFPWGACELCCEWSEWELDSNGANCKSSSFLWCDSIFLEWPATENESCSNLRRLPSHTYVAIAIMRIHRSALRCCLQRNSGGRCHLSACCGNKTVSALEKFISTYVGNIWSTYRRTSI